MSNLIITIISIGLVAIAAIMGIYYGGVAYSNAQINAIANAIMNEQQQILTAERIWATNNNQPDISGMGTATANGVGISALINSKILAEWPTPGGIENTQFAVPGAAFASGSGGFTATTATYDYGCYSISGYLGKFVRIPFPYANGNYVLYIFGANLPYNGTCASYSTGGFATSSTDVSQINHPIVKIAKAINAAMNQIPANADRSYMTSGIGLPRPPTGSTSGSPSSIWDPSNFYISYVNFDTNGTIQTNYCYLQGGAAVTCVFGPS